MEWLKWYALWRLLRWLAPALRGYAHAVLPESCHDCVDDLLDMALYDWRLR